MLYQNQSIEYCKIAIKETISSIIRIMIATKEIIVDKDELKEAICRILVNEWKDYKSDVIY